MGRTTSRKPVRPGRRARTGTRRGTGTSSAPIAGFYDRLAGTYDVMTNFEHRFLREGQMLRMLVVRNRLKTALDAGCGTGFHALFLARLGVRTTAVDLSPLMLERVREHARRMGVKVATLRAGFGSLARRLRRKFDAIVCMGNTLAHLGSAEELLGALRQFARLLEPGGFLVVQLLDFDRIGKAGALPRIVRETEAGEFTRSYTLTRTGIRLTIEHRPPGSRAVSRQALDLRPVYHSELLSLLHAAGFAQIELFGSIEMEPYDPAATNDIVIIART